MHQWMQASSFHRNKYYGQKGQGIKGKAQPNKGFNPWHPTNIMSPQFMWLGKRSEPTYNVKVDMKRQTGGYNQQV